MHFTKLLHALHTFCLHVRYSCNCMGIRLSFQPFHRMPSFFEKAYCIKKDASASAQTYGTFFKRIQYRMEDFILQRNRSRATPSATNRLPFPMPHILKNSSKEDYDLLQGCRTSCSNTSIHSELTYSEVFCMVSLTFILQMAYLYLII